MTHSPRGIVPPYLLTRIARLDEPRFQRAAAAAAATLTADEPRRAARLELSIDADNNIVVELRGSATRTVSDAAGTEVLPGKVVRREGADAVGDPAADEAYDGLGATFTFFSEVLDRDSIDGRSLPLDATVHYGERMVFGDGDDEVFRRFTVSLTVIGHELAHGVTEYTAGLIYQGQSGALNESISDVFGSLVEQYALGQTVTEASWLIGAGLFTDEVQGAALRSMKAPGTAYDDDVLGKDPQPAHLRDYIDTDDDNGGVHLNSGIPNRAFYLAAEALGGSAWERAGLIWYDALTSGLRPTTDFAGFAAATVAAASARYGESSDEIEAVRAGWAGVGIELPTDTSDAGADQDGTER